MNDLADFLLARIAEDEASVTDVLRKQPVWRLGLSNVGELGGTEVRDEETSVVAFARGDEVATHIAHWDPERVLAECRAKRLIVEDHRAQLEAHRTGWDIRSPRDYPLRALALSYVGHPDFRREWRP